MRNFNQDLADTLVLGMPQILGPKYSIPDIWMKSIILQWRKLINLSHHFIFQQFLLTQCSNTKLHDIALDYTIRLYKLCL